MRLRELFPHAQGDPEVTSLAYDGRSVQPGALFFCVRGFTRDGHDFAPGAIADGAVALVVDHPLGLGVPEVRVDDVRAAMAPVAARFHGDPSARLTSSASPARAARRPRRSSSASCSRAPAAAPRCSGP